MGEASHPEVLERLNIPSAPPQQLSPHLTLQPPLSRRGSGPGLILVVDHYARLEVSEKSLDPPPLQKWAEEGFAVVQLKVPGKREDGGEFPLDRAIEALKRCEQCIWGNGVGLISYMTRIPFYVEEAAYLSPHIKALISYGGRKFTSVSSLMSRNASLPAQLVHASGPEAPRRESISVLSDTDTLQATPPEGPVKAYHYVNAKLESKWILPADPDYHSTSASIAHTRSLAFLKPLLNGPYFDLEAIWDEHCLYEFGERDVSRTMATMVAQPYVNHIPTLTGGIGQERLTHFYTNHFVHANPDDTELELVSRTVGTDRVVDEFVFKLTHNRQVDWLLPGIPPTGKYLEIPFTSIVGMRGDRLCHEHIHWDQGTAMRQAGILPEWLRYPYSIDGKESSEGKRYEVRAPTTGVETARKLVDEGSLESNRLMETQWREVDDI
ncbi:NTF2-like protein [Bimuria novae-zelandiae CBS 107.79]|uniref:NTF2-like protein n=1 Tax=Bimuria novae-zelandiae CBS 107.79 TaxID=1447943 RepID=A0A6A5VIH2_9PLEO|nr:NTF2-like protein [Bimuria novae-zelandiae CBS 107.79]